VSRPGYGEWAEPARAAVRAPTAAPLPDPARIRAGSGNARRRTRDRGSATAELAMGLPALLVLLFAGLTAVGAVTTKLQCVDAAREAALAAARGEPGAEAGQRAAPTGAEVSVTVEGDTVTATVHAPVPLLGGRLPGLRVDASAVAVVEPGSPGPVP
jgi:Flp pilus assembly protein TadG